MLEADSGAHKSRGTGRRLLWLSLASAVLAGLVLLTAYYTWQVIEARRLTKEEIIPRLRQTAWPITARDLSPAWRDILLKVEDPAFFSHGGVDLSTPGAGLTTITQGLVKVLYFENFRPGFQKPRQTLIAWLALDPLVSKEDQLTLFLNLIGLGQGTRGFDQAARHYYGKEFSQLSQEQYISLVAMIVAPRTFNLRTQPQRNALRVARIKELVAGRYKPKGLCDLFYGPLDQETQKGLAPMSYFESYYRN